MARLADRLKRASSHAEYQRIQCVLSLVLPWVNAETMSLSLAEVAQRHAEEFVVMVMDQAGWHLASELAVLTNVRPIFLPPYSPELNPAEHLWESLREDCFANHVSRTSTPSSVRSAKAW